MTLRLHRFDYNTFTTLTSMVPYYGSPTGEELREEYVTRFGRPGPDVEATFYRHLLLSLDVLREYDLVERADNAITVKAPLEEIEVFHGKVATHSRYPVAVQERAKTEHEAKKAERQKIREQMGHEAYRDWRKRTSKDTERRAIAEVNEFLESWGFSSKRYAECVHTALQERVRLKDLGVRDV